MLGGPHWLTGASVFINGEGGSGSGESSSLGGWLVSHPPSWALDRDTPHTHTHTHTHSLTPLPSPALNQVWSDSAQWAMQVVHVHCMLGYWQLLDRYVMWWSCDQWVTKLEHIYMYMYSQMLFSKCDKPHVQPCSSMGSGGGGGGGGGGGEGGGKRKVLGSFTSMCV